MGSGMMRRRSVGTVVTMGLLVGVHCSDDASQIASTGDGGARDAGGDSIAARDAGEPAMGADAGGTSYGQADAADAAEDAEPQGDAADAAEDAGVLADSGCWGDAGSPADDGGIPAIIPPKEGDPCSEPGAQRCADRTKFLTCAGGSWTSPTKCEAWGTCAAGGCRRACSDLVAPAGAVIACYMPVDPLGPGTYHNAPITVVNLTSDPQGGMPHIYGAAFRTVDVLKEDNDTLAPVVADPLGVVWSNRATSWATGSIYLKAAFELKDFVARYGGPPSAMTLHVKMRTVADACRVPPSGVLTLSNGTGAWLTFGEDDTDQFHADEEWVVRTRDFNAGELKGLSIDGTMNVLEQGWSGDSLRLTVPRTIQVAWFALTYTPPK
jgi:hypothetical protein